MTGSINILFIEDSEEDYELMLLELKRFDIKINSDRIDTENELIKRLQNDKCDIIICDNQLPNLNGQRALEVVRTYKRSMPFIIVSGSIGEEAGADMMRQGVSDYMLKGNLRRLAPAVEREVNDYRQRLKQIENSKNLILSELRYQNLTESIQDIFFAIDLNLNITFWNSSAAEEFHEEGPIGENIFKIFPQWRQKSIGLAIVQALQNEETIWVELTQEFDGPEYFEGTVSNAGNGATILLRKVTERYLNRARLEKLNAELETLLYRIGHDLKGPVSSVTGLLNVMRAEEKFDKDQFLTMMEARMKNLEDTLKVLRDLASIKYGASTNVIINLKTLLKKIIDDLVLIDRCSNEDIELEVDSDLEFLSDLSMVTSICQNLLENAVKYSCEQGKETRIRVSASLKGKVLELVVLDNGPGIPEDIQERIYEMFYRGDSRSDGSGLGLYIVKNALMKMNGCIELDTTYENGAKFNVSIPII